MTSCIRAPARHPPCLHLVSGCLLQTADLIQGYQIFFLCTWKIFPSKLKSLNEICDNRDMFFFQHSCKNKSFQSSRDRNDLLVA